MTRVPQMAGDTYADIITWRWDRSRLVWEAVVRDGSILRALLRRGGRKVWWIAETLCASEQHDWRSGDVFKHPDQAQQAALAHWQKVCR